MVCEVPTPPLKGQAQTSIPCYVSELSSVPNQRQPDLLLIDLISSYREARVEEMALIRSQHVSDVGTFITGNLGHGLALSGSDPPLYSFRVHGRAFSVTPHSSSPRLPWKEAESPIRLLSTSLISSNPGQKFPEFHSEHRMQRNLIC